MWITQRLVKNVENGVRIEGEDKGCEFVDGPSRMSIYSSYTLNLSGKPRGSRSGEVMIPELHKRRHILE